MEEKEEFNGFDDRGLDNLQEYVKNICERANKNVETPQFIKEMIEKTKNQKQIS